MTRRMMISLSCAVMSFVVTLGVATPVFAKPLSYEIPKTGIYTVSLWSISDGSPNTVTRWGKVLPSGKVKTLAELRGMALAAGADYSPLAKRVYVVTSNCDVWSFSPKNPAATLVKKGTLDVNRIYVSTQSCLGLEVNSDGDLVVTHGSWNDFSHYVEIFDADNLLSIGTFPFLPRLASDYVVSYATNSRGATLTARRSGLLETWTPELTSAHTNTDYSPGILSASFDRRDRPWVLSWDEVDGTIYSRLGLYSASKGTIRWGRALGEGAKMRPTWWTWCFVFLPAAR